MRFNIFKSCVLVIALMEQKRKILKSRLFDKDYYLKYNPDVKQSRLDPLTHYLLYGAKEGRNPSPIFNGRYYLETNKDVRESRLNPLYHYVKYGRKEGRKMNLSSKIDISIMKKKHLEKKRKELIHFLRGSNRIDLLYEKPRISVILVLFNKAELTFACLQALKRNSKIPLEIIIVDNHSTDQTHKLLSKVNVSRVIYNKTNLHFLTACNQAITHVSTTNVLFLNNDTEIEKGALSNALKSLHESKNNGAVGAKLILPDGTLQEAGNIIWNDGSCLGYGRNDNPMLPEYNFKRVVDYCSGAFLLTKTELLTKHGGFDIQFNPAYYEETDYCLWLQENNFKVIYDPNVIVKHFEFGSSAKEMGVELQKVNRSKFLTKHSQQLKNHLAYSKSNILKARSSASGVMTKKILYVEDRVPYPFIGCGYPRSYSILKCLEKLGYFITLYPSLLQFNEKYEEIYHYFSHFTEVIIDHGHVEFSDFLKSRQNYYDFIWISRPHNMKYCQKALMEYKGKSKIIYDAEAIFAERDIAKDALLSGKNQQQKHEQNLNNEIELSKLADLLFAVSDQDAAKFQDYGIKNVKVLGHAININPTPKGFSERRGLLFVGNLDNEDSPNVDSIIWFTKEVYPIIRNYDPEINLHIVGSNKAKRIKNLNITGVKIHGKLENLSGFYDSCRVYIAPTRYAAGIPYKVHEAASYGIPIVASNLLVKQLEWQDEYHLLSSDIEAIHFADQVIRLYKDKLMWNYLRKNALHSIKVDHSFHNFSKTILDSITELINDK